MVVWLQVPGYTVIQQAVPNFNISNNIVQAISGLFCLHECLSLRLFLVGLFFVCLFVCIHKLIWESVHRSLTSVHSSLRTFCRTDNVIHSS